MSNVKFSKESHIFKFFLDNWLRIGIGDGYGTQIRGNAIRWFGETENDFAATAQFVWSNSDGSYMIHNGFPEGASRNHYSKANNFLDITKEDWQESSARTGIRVSRVQLANVYDPIQ